MTTGCVTVWRKALALRILVGAGVALSAQGSQPSAETILINGHVITVDAQFSIAQAVAIANGKFVAVGTNAEIRRLAGPATKVIDLQGQTAIPGLADGHLHDAGGGPGVDLSRARSIADVLAAVAARVKQAAPDDVIVSNSDWHEAQLKEHRLPYRADLDTVAPANPVVLVRGGHEYILNSAALRKWNVDDKHRRTTRRSHYSRIGRRTERRAGGPGEGARHATAANQADHRRTRGATSNVECRRTDQHSLSRCIGRAVPTAAGHGASRHVDDAGQCSCCGCRPIPENAMRAGGRRDRHQARRRRRVGSDRRHEARGRRRFRRRLDARTVRRTVGREGHVPRRQHDEGRGFHERCA